MIYEDFFKVVEDVFKIKHSYLDHKGKKVFYDQWVHDSDETKFCINHIVGGVSGGSCWDDSNTREFTNDDPMPEVDISDLLSKICPNISFLQYNKLIKEVLETKNYTNKEYYGNYDNHVKKTIYWRELYDHLVKNNIISDVKIE